MDLIDTLRWWATGDSIRSSQHCCPDYGDLARGGGEYCLVCGGALTVVDVNPADGEPPY